MSSEKKYKILAIDDDPSVLELFGTLLRREYEVHFASSCEEARQLTARHDFQVVLLDLGLPDGDGMDLLRYFKEINEYIEVIIVTMRQSTRQAVEAIRLGAFDYVNKDFIPDELKISVSNALDKHLRHRRILSLQSQQEGIADNDNFILGRSPQIKKINEMVEKLAKVPANVLITGESGTGKEVIARRLHTLSFGPCAPFISVNIAAVPAELVEATLFGHERGSFTGAHRLNYGKFELADGGTLFLDEIGDLRFDLQAKLLRAIQEKVIERVGGVKPIPFNARIVAATNANLEKKVQEGQFREDLYYRLNVVRIHLPPLRERPEDIPELVRLFIRKYNQKFKRNVGDISELVLAVLSNYSWPGNIRELENLVERLIVLTEKTVITESDIPVEYLVSDLDALRQRSPEGDILAQATEAFERSFILKVMEQKDWNQNLAAAQLGVHRKTLEYKIRKYQIRPIIVQKRSRRFLED